jgi:hypothetical protein
MSRPVWLLEIDLDFCTLRHPAGNLPGAEVCAATGDVPCYNTWSTCQDGDSFTRGVKTYRFVEPLADLPPWLDAWPYLESVSLRGGIIDPGRSLGQRAQFTARLKGGRHHDRGVDPYAALRPYDPATQGTMLGKLRARNPYYALRPARVLRGDLDRIEADANLDSCEVRRFVLAGFAHAGDEWTITGKDPLKLADGDRAVWPRHSTGELAADITAVATTLQLSPEGIDEIMAFTRDGDTLTVTRTASVAGIWVTTPDDHKAGDSVQLCVAYVDVPAWQIAREILVEAAGLDPAFIDDAAWQTEFESYLPTQNLSAFIAKPEKADKLLSEVQRDANFYLYWVERENRVALKALRFPLTSEVIPRLDDASSAIAGSIEIDDRPEDRISRAVVFYGQRDPTMSLEENGNFRRVLIDTDEESAGVNEYQSPQVETIYSRWHPSGAKPNVLSFARRLVVTFARVRRSIEVEVALKDAGLGLGDLVDIATRRAEGPTGAAETLRARVYSEAPTKNGVRIELRESVFTSRRLVIWAPDELVGLHWDDATEEQREMFMFWAGDDGLMPDGSVGFAWA